jgi:hypothetical protein
MKSMVREHFVDLDIDGRTAKIVSEFQESGLPKMLIYCKGNHEDSNKNLFPKFRKLDPKLRVVT